MVIALILCLIGNYICFYFTAKNYKKNNKSGLFFLLGIILSIVSAILLVNIIDNNTKSAAVGNYNYYINGKKVSRNAFAATNNWLWGFLFSGLFVGSGLFLSTFIIKKTNKVNEVIYEEKK